MKKILLLVQFLIISFLSVSQAPNGFNYQAVVRDGTGAPKVNQNVVFTFKIVLRYLWELYLKHYNFV